ncbi:CHC2 zinc finger domain-containing protein [Kineococcus esterisolvens]|uniref:CHC2 zinc finger domain-containing protein n=1 Tax=unclassified Kineococcus TaxID=2621656 RepID=UPI003D7E1E47
MTEKPELRDVLEHLGVTLKGRDKQMVACPLHGDRTPSCSVDLHKNLWSCHSCLHGGDSYQLLMDKLGLTFPQAKNYAKENRLGAVEVGGQEEVTGSAYGARRRKAGAGKSKTGGGYTPSWRR